MTTYEFERWIIALRRYMLSYGIRSDKPRVRGEMVTLNFRATIGDKRYNLSRRYTPHMLEVHGTPVSEGRRLREAFAAPMEYAR